MCGIAGFAGRGTSETLSRMTETLKHRGPDDQGIFCIPGIGLGHTRLAIIDLSPRGKQPMHSADGKLTIVFNGEIYNYQTLKQELIRLGSYHFSGESDTEVILALFQRMGPEAFKKLNGMFALAIYDHATHTLTLARDRLGKKPLYYGIFGETLLFGSEPKALLKHPSFVKKINLQALYYYLRHEYVPTPLSIFDGVQKLEPGTYAVWQDHKLTKKTFWAPTCTETSIPFSEALAGLDKHLERSVTSRLIADVPLGIFLSGGIDSSTISYYAQKNSTQKIKTFSIAFEEKSFDESSYARLVSRHLGTDHHEETLTARDALDLVPSLADLLDEPLADPSLIPTYLLSRFTKKHVTVALGGDGGDELLAGYDTFRALRFSLLYTKLPVMLRAQILEPLTGLLPETESNMNIGFVAKRFFNGLKQPESTRVQTWMQAFSPNSLHELLKTQATNLQDEALPLERDYRGSENAYQKLIYQYLRTYLIDDILAKVDRASMYTALEVRAPFLDYELVDFVNALPASYKLHGMTGKYILKKLMEDRLPRDIVYRKKKGFGIPLTRWLKHELKPLMHDLLSETRLAEQGIFNPLYVNTLVQNHLQGRRDHRKELWTLLVFQMWYDRWYR